MRLYHDTEKESFFPDDYKPLPTLRGLSLDDLRELKENIDDMAGSAYLYHSELLEMVLKMDSNKVNLYIRMQEKRERKCAKQTPAT